MVATWSDSDPSSFESEPEIEIKANLCLMAINDEVCLDDFDKLQNEYECIFDDFEKIKHRCKDYKKIITTLTIDVENAKHEYDVVIDRKNELEKYLDAMKSKNEAFQLELEEKCKALDICLNENTALKVSASKKEKHTNHMCRRSILSGLLRSFWSLSGLGPIYIKDRVVGLERFPFILLILFYRVFESFCVQLLFGINFSYLISFRVNFCFMFNCCVMSFRI